MRHHERRDQRYRARVRVALLSRNEDTPAVTEDVGYRGIFLRIDTPPKKMQLLRMKITLPDGSDIVVHGVGKHVVEPGKSGGRAAGIGVEFFGMDGTSRKKWEAFVQMVAIEPVELELSDDDLLEVIEPAEESMDGFAIDVMVSMPPAA